MSFSPSSLFCCGFAHFMSHMSNQRENEQMNESLIIQRVQNAHSF